MEGKEDRIRKITAIYYSNPKIQEAILKFAKNREIVPKYFEQFGKRPDTIQYSSDISGLARTGATSFHSSEEIWHDPLQISSEMNIGELNNLRKGWDLLIDIDSQYLDISKEAAKLILELFKRYGIRNYGIKFSGNKGFHIIVSGKAFPEEYGGKLMRESFPEWPRAITEFIFNEIKPEFRKRAGKIASFSQLEKNKDVIRISCKNCDNIASKGELTKLKCGICNLEIERRDIKKNKRRVQCLNQKCAGILEIVSSADYYYCNNCKDPNNEKLPLSSNKYPKMFGEIRGELVEEHAKLDLVLVASRHLFRMPYSLHEKTALVSVVIKEDEIEKFEPVRDANPLRVRVLDFLSNNEIGEGKRLLASALEWKKMQMQGEEQIRKSSYEKIDVKGVNEEMFPEPIKKLLLGLKDGKKRGLFILLTFLKSLNFSPEYIDMKIREWNKLNEPPLKEGYVKSQIDWHLKQKRQILPPNYSNNSFYKDLGLLDEKPDAKNPIVEVLRKFRKAE